LSRYTVLPWENADEYRALVAALAAEHAPQGPIEEHLVEELAGVIWRKRRLRLAEAATYQRELLTATQCEKTKAAALVLTDVRADDVHVVDAVTTTAKEAAREKSDLAADRAMTVRAIALLADATHSAYVAALGALHESTREAWTNKLAWTPDDYGDGDMPYAVTAADLRRFLNDEILPWYNERCSALAAMPAVRAQALGESLDPDKLERLSRYEVHLDRKLERSLAMLIRLREVRCAAGEGGGVNLFGKTA